MTELIEKFQTIQEYYEFVDKQQFRATTLPLVENKVCKFIIELPEIDKQNIELEIDCLRFLIRDGKIKPCYSGTNDKGETVVYPNLDSINDDSIQYLTNRAITCKNIYLKTRILHIIWQKTKNYEYLKQTIDSYFNFIPEYRQLDKEHPTEHYGIEVCYSLWNLQELVFSTNYKKEELKSLILEIINNPNKESTCFLKLQLDCIKIFYERAKKGKLEKDTLKGFEQICETTITNDISDLFIESYMDMGKNISRLLETDYKKWILRQAEYYENLSNISDTIIAPEYCQKAIDLYQELNNDKKVDELYKKYSFLVKNIQMNIISSQPVDLRPIIESYENLAEKLNEDDILKYLIYSSDILPNYQNEKEEILNNEQGTSIMSCISTSVIDEYGHIIDKIDDDDKILKNQIFRKYEIWFNIETKILFYYLKKAIQLNKLTKGSMIKFLSTTWLGYKLSKNLTQDRVYTYAWLDYIQEPIENFIIKFTEYVNNESKPLIFISEIDSLSLKIEGILRDLITIFDIDGFNAFYFDKNKNFKWNNINNYLYHENIQQIIPENDLWFLRYCLIDYKNIRNRVAHSLMFLGEYGIENMILVFLVILRLLKYSISNNSDNL